MRKATEEEYFRKHNAELAAKLKARAGLKEAGVKDPALMESLTQAGFSEDSVRALFLLPLLDVAWADGRLESEERREIEGVVAARGIAKDSEASALLERWLARNPESDEKFQRGKALIGPLLADVQSTGTAWILEASRRVAHAAGGLFGFGSKISGAEEEVLKKLSEKLSKR